MPTGCPWLLPLHLCHGNNWTCRTTHTTSPQRKRTRREPLSEVHAKQPLEKWQPQSMWQRRHRNQNRIKYANPDETTLSQRVLEQKKTKWHSRKAASAPSPQLGSSCPQCFFQLKIFTLSLLMSEHPKQVSLFFETAQCMSSGVIDNLKLMSSTSVRSTATMRYWMKKTTNATFGFDKGNWFRSSSPDSRRRRCTFVGASRKSDRSFIGAFLPDLFNVKHQFFRYLSNSSGYGQ